MDERHYQPLQKSIEQLNDLTAKYRNGYVALIGSAGSGKSTLLTKWLQQSDSRVLKYFSYVNQDMTYDAGYRGESKYFLHDIITQLRILQPTLNENIPGNERTELAIQFREELVRFSSDYKRDRIKTIIVVDGLDHIEREQNVEYSLIKELPPPDSIPEGIYFILGSRTIDGLKDLNTNIKLDIHQNEKAVDISPLAKTEMYNIVKSYPQLSLNEDQLERISINTHGHPLFLRYTIERLLSAPFPEYNVVIEDQKFTGDIINQYQKFWRTIEKEEDLKTLLSVIARFRFSFVDIELLEKSFQFTDAVLNKLLFYTRHFFYVPEASKWQYFHNSFKSFLEEWTAKAPLTGKFNTTKDEQIHSHIANCIEQSNSNYRWNIVYHLFKAKQYNKIISLASQEYFRQQWHQFRNYKFIHEDVSIASRAAYYEKNVVAWLRYLLCSSELNQRLIEFDPSDYFELYLQLGLQDVADSYIFNGRELLTTKEKALDYAYELFHKGEKEHARKIFELAEPTFIIHHSKTIERNRYVSHLYTEIDEIALIKKWATTAVYFQDVSEVFSIIESLTVSDSHNYHGETKEEFQKRIKLNLLADTYTAVAESFIKVKDWKQVIICLEHIQKKIGKGWTLLNIISTILFDTSEKNQAVSDYCIQKLRDWGEAKNDQVVLQLSLLYTYALNEPTKAKTYFDRLPAPKWKKKKIYIANSFLSIYLIMSGCITFSQETLKPALKLSCQMLKRMTSEYWTDRFALSLAFTLCFTLDKKKH